MFSVSAGGSSPRPLAGAGRSNGGHRDLFGAFGLRALTLSLCRPAPSEKGLRDVYHEEGNYPSPRSEVIVCRAPGSDPLRRRESGGGVNSEDRAKFIMRTSRNTRLYGGGGGGTYSGLYRRTERLDAHRTNRNKHG